MGTVHRLPSIDDRPTATDRDAVRPPELEVPGWEELTAARDRFFARLQDEPGIRSHDGEAPAAADRATG